MSREELVRVLRPAEVEALRVVAAERDELLVLVFGLDAFGDDRQLDVVREIDDAAHDREVARVAPERRDEAAVDLDDGDRKVLHVRERRVAGAEVVDGERDAEVVQRLEPALLAARVDRHPALGELEREPDLPRVDALGREQPGDLVDEVLFGELAGREVDAQVEVVAAARGRGSSARRSRTRRR